MFSAKKNANRGLTHHRFRENVRLNYESERHDFRLLILRPFCNVRAIFDNFAPLCSAKLSVKVISDNQPAFFSKRKK